MKIGFLDSGIGGLSVLHDALQMFKNEQFIFYADKSNAPYGEKTEEQVFEYTKNAIEFLTEHDSKIIVIACNTATSVAANRLRETFNVPIIGMEPAVKKAIDHDERHRVLVTATPITVAGNKLKTLVAKVDKHHHVDLVALPKLVRFAESGVFEDDAIADYLSTEFSKFNLEDYSSVVLGCTHFNYFKDSYRKVLPDHVEFIDGIDGTLNQLARKLKEFNLEENTSQSVEYYYSGKLVNNDVELQYIDSLMKRLDYVKTVL